MHNAARKLCPKLILIHAQIPTGGNSGIGFQCALEIAKRRGTVHLVCRNEKLGITAKDDIIKETKNDNIFLHVVDLSQPKQIIEFTTKFCEDHDNLNVLVRQIWQL